MDAPEENLTAVLHAVNDLRLENRPIPVPKDDEVLLEMHCVGICGSDVHYYVKGAIGDFVLKEPMVMGHEASGVVVEIGKNVKNLKPGDRVAIEPGVPCRKCSYCKEGCYNLCRDIVFCATPPYHGNLARYYTHAADFCYKLPDYLTMEEGALLEPLAVGVHACRKANVTLGSTVLITGSGPIGLVSLIAAKAMGASKVLVTDVVTQRLNLAKSFGADGVLSVRKYDTEPILAEKVKEALGGMPSICIECSGVESSIRLAIVAVRAGGTVVMVGMGPQDVKVPLINACCREVVIKGVFRYANDYPLAMELLSTGKVDIRKMITHNYTLEETLLAYDTARTGQGNPVKIMIHCNK
ncbi:sorbitol dehydrogenase-like [Ischnura elegans]|uniref:sorbitol dehydrogenase-like n=1 Tax=Ischnura elegans TaxID=197161 RepID=UPI001ED8AD1D|nr:sorbitol dehydrogenase-like [Ischnura elegans]